MMSKISITGMILGAIFAIVSFIQYYVLYHDVDRVIAYPTIGLLVMAVFYLYNENLELNNRLAGVEDYLADKK